MLFHYCSTLQIRKRSLTSLITHRSFHGKKVAIVGSGPSACYTAKYLLPHVDQIDVLERLPTPYGLVRYGVAPDHPEVKNVQNDFAHVLEKVNYYGNVHVGKDVSINELREMYNGGVVLAYGCCESDQKLHIPGADSLAGIMSAREFVAWYNGHPEYAHIGEQVKSALGSESGGNDNHIHNASVVVIGQGNVALDCARVLVKARSGLEYTDITQRALDVLKQGVSKVSIIGRRGHIQGAFTIKELRELVKLEQEGHETAFIVRKDELDLGSTEASLEELKNARPKTRIDILLREAASRKDFSTATKLPRQVHLRFLLNPIRFLASEIDPSRLGAVECVRTRLEGEPGKQRALATNETELIPAQLALVSIGYRGVPLPGTEQWFDDSKGVFIHQHGRVDAANENLGALYAAGWIKRGPSGIIGTNIPDAKETVATIVDDLQSPMKAHYPSDKEILELLKSRGVKVVKWNDYRRIEAEEERMKRKLEQPREKITDLEKMLEVAFS